MRNIFVGAILTVTMLFLSIFSVFAEEETIVTLDEASASSLQLRWNKVENAYGYYVAYGKTSIQEGNYEMELDELVEGTKVTLKDLNGNTQYFVSVTAVDENGDEILTTQEQSFSTLKATKLLLQGVDVVGKKTVKLSFSSEIDETKQKDFILKSLSNRLEVGINDLRVEGSVIFVSVDTDFVSNEKYSIVIISLFGKDGSTIVSGIDGAVEFSAPDMSQFDKEEVAEEVTQGTLDNSQQQNPSAQSEVAVDASDDSGDVNAEVVMDSQTNAAVVDVEENIELNAAGPEENNSEVQTENAQENVNLAGEELSQEESQELEKNISVAAENNENLPSTGPQHIFLLLLALTLGILIFHFNTRKS